MKRLLVLLTLIFAMTPMLALAHDGDHYHPTPGPTSSGTVKFPSDGQTPGERSPWVAGVAAITIIGAGAAGIYIYRLIKQGI